MQTRQDISLVIIIHVASIWNLVTSFQSNIGHVSTAWTSPMTAGLTSRAHEADQTKGIIFDIDGTLANSWKLGFDATQKVLSNNNIPLITEDLYHECTKYCTPDRLARHAGYVPEDGDPFQRVGEKLGKEFDDLYVGLVSPVTAGFYDGITELLMSFPAENIKIGALTNACVAYAHAVLKVNCPKLNPRHMNFHTTDLRKGIYENFLTIHGADTVEKPKPSPLGLLRCCQDLGLEPSQCVYVGDSPSDAVAAKSAGMTAIGVLWGSHSEDSLRKAPFDTLCSSVQELQVCLYRFHHHY